MSDDVETRRFESNLYVSMVEALTSDNPLLQTITDLPEFQQQYAEQEEMLHFVNLRRKLSVADDFADQAVEDIVSAASLLTELFLKGLDRNTRTIKIDTPSGSLSVQYTRPLGR